ncbi:hypothetical protein KAR48_06885 [bacterium]|nr:hypothetical protein [bacterium]
MKHRITLILTLLILLFTVQVQADDIKIGVYTHLIEIPGGDFDAVCAQLETALTASDFDSAGAWELDTPNPHDYRAKVFVITDSAYTVAVSALEGHRFLAVPLRFAVYEGVGKQSIKINMTNPVAAAMVYFHEADGYTSLIESARLLKDRMVMIVDGAFEGSITSEDIAPLRSESALNGYNGDGPAKVMAMFKNYRKSLKAVSKEKSGDNAQAAFEKACAVFEANIAKTKEGWKIIASTSGDRRKLYSISRPETEALAMKIVGIARDSDDDPVPGIDHAAAFPIEVLIFEEDGKILTTTLGEMWRMQFYFWDAGYGAFAKHAQVPSQIFGSIKKVIKGK